MPQLGYTTVATTAPITGASGDINVYGGFKTDAVGGIVTSIAAYINSVSGTSQELRLVIFTGDNSTGLPTTTLVGVTDFIVVTSAVAPGLVTFGGWSQFGGAPTLAPNTWYWVGIWYGASVGSGAVSSDYDPYGGNHYQQATVTFSETGNPIVSGWTDGSASITTTMFITYGALVPVQVAATNGSAGFVNSVIITVPTAGIPKGALIEWVIITYWAGDVTVFDTHGGKWTVNRASLQSSSGSGYGTFTVYFVQTVAQVPYVSGDTITLQYGTATDYVGTYYRMNYWTVGGPGPGPLWALDRLHSNAQNNSGGTNLVLPDSGTFGTGMVNELVLVVAETESEPNTLVPPSGFTQDWWDNSGGTSGGGTPGDPNFYTYYQVYATPQSSVSATFTPGSSDAPNGLIAGFYLTGMTTANQRYSQFRFPKPRLRR